MLAQWYYCSSTLTCATQTSYLPVRSRGRLAAIGALVREQRGGESRHDATPHGHEGAHIFERPRQPGRLQRDVQPSPTMAECGSARRLLFDLACNL